MKTKNATVLGIAAGALMLSALPAAAAVEVGSQEVSVYGGWSWGDEITDAALDGTRPKLDDDAVFGVRYAYHFTDQWGLELSAGHSPNAVTRLVGGDTDLDLTTLDVNAVWHIGTQSPIVPYLTAGIGYAIADLDRPLTGVVNGAAVSIDDDDGFTANAGVGVKYFATDAVVLRLEARYRYLDKVIDAFDRSLSTVETTLGVSWQF